MTSENVRRYMCKYRQYIHKYSTINPQISLRNLYGQAGWAKIPTFTENLFCMLPLASFHKCVLPININIIFSKKGEI